MTTKYSTKRICAAVIAVVLLVCALYVPQTAALTDAERAEQLKDEIAALESKIAANDKKIAELKAKAEGQQDYINELQSQVNAVSAKVDLMNEGIAAVQSDIDVIDGEISDINDEIAALENRIAELDAEILSKEQEIAATYTLLGQRIRALYIAGPTSELELLLTEDSFEYEAFLTRLELLNRISEHDNGLIESIYAAIDAIKVMQGELDVAIDEQNSAIAELDAKKAELEAKKAEQEKARNLVKAEEDKIQASLDEIKSYVSSLNATSAQYARVNDAAEDTIASYEKKILALLAPKVSTGSGVSSSGFIWPLQYNNTYISSSFKMRTLNGVTRQHNGIDVCVSGGTYGATISAVASGKVVVAYHSGYNGGYGLYVVIDHGNGIQTYYCHCSAVSVSAGQSVSQGQSIGKVGNSGYSFGPHLHFGVSVNGGFVNPINYVNKPSDCSVQG